jgi:Zn-finger nucleic acid-binding protein
LDRSGDATNYLMTRESAGMMVVENRHPPPKETVMNCPHCQTELHHRSIEGVVIDECRDCQGIWLDAEKLRRLKDAADPDLRWMDFELWDHADRFQIAEKAVDCPTCAVPLVAIDYGDTGVTIDYCNGCRGVWLDAGGFGKIIAHLSEDLLTTESSEYLRASLDEAKELITGPESFLSEWKDFVTVLRMLEYRLLSENPKLASALAEFQAKSPI